MRLSISYQEINQLIRSKIDEKCEVGYSGERTRVRIDLFKMHLYVKKESLYDNVLVLSHQIGDDADDDNFFVRAFKLIAQNTARRVVNRLIGKFVKIPAVSVNEMKSVNIDLNKIGQIESLLQIAALDDINFDENNINIEVKLK